MAADVARTGAQFLFAPFLAAARFMQRQASGPRAVLQVDVGPLPDVRMRTIWLERLRRVAADRSIVAVMLHIQGSPGSWASASALREVIAGIRAEGTRVYARLESPGSGAMWLASACDRVFLVPTGQIALLGVGAELTFFGAALEHLGVAPDFEAAGAYKSFGEPYTRTFASPAYQESIGAIVGDLQEQLVTGIAEGRQIQPEAVRHALSMAPLHADEARQLKLVDELFYDDQIREWLKEQHGKPLRIVDYGQWARWDTAVERIEKASEAGKAVAVVYLDGPIVMDEGGRGTAIRGHKVVEVLRKLRLESKTAAVVLYVNSPGGSALASDLIWREVALLNEKKPVIACFEDVAASGGYYLAAPAREIFARPGSLTGSIGVFGGKLVVGEGLRKLGVHTQQVGGSPNAHLFSPSRPFTDAQRVRFREMLQRTYDGFVERVATGRGVSVDAVEPYCRGRVWTGADAKERGLVDHFGGLDEAVRRAAELAELGAWRRMDVSTLPRRSALQWALQRALPAAAASIVPPVVGVMHALLPAGLTAGAELLARHPGQVLALLPVDLRLDR